jgi:hypothetical protein
MIKQYRAKERKEHVHTSFLSSIVPLDVGTKPVSDVLLSIVPLVDNPRVSSICIVGSFLSRSLSVEQLNSGVDRQVASSVDLISFAGIFTALRLFFVEALNVRLRVTDVRLFCRLNSDEDSLVPSTNSNRPIGSYE